MSEQKYRKLTSDDRIQEKDKVLSYDTWEYEPISDLPSLIGLPFLSCHGTIIRAIPDDYMPEVGTGYHLLTEKEEHRAGDFIWDGREQIYGWSMTDNPFFKNKQGFIAKRSDNYRQVSIGELLCEIDLVENSKGEWNNVPLSLVGNKVVNYTHKVIRPIPPNYLPVVGTSYKLLDVGDYTRIGDEVWLKVGRVFGWYSIERREGAAGGLAGTDLSELPIIAETSAYTRRLIPNPPYPKEGYRLLMKGEFIRVTDDYWEVEPVTGDGSWVTVNEYPDIDDNIASNHSIRRTIKDSADSNRYADENLYAWQKDSKIYVQLYGKQYKFTILGNTPNSREFLVDDQLRSFFGCVDYMLNGDGEREYYPFLTWVLAHRFIGVDMSKTYSSEILDYIANCGQPI